MLKRPFKSVIARIAIVALALSLVFPFIPAALADGHISLTYAENGTDSVQRFHASDQEGSDITWSLDGTDKEDFDISDAGVLSFKESPNFEKPADADKNNVYSIIVVAAGKTKAEQKVEVTVTDVAEAGKVTFSGLGMYQPQVGRGLSASLSDPDTGNPTNVKWQWARGPNADGPWTDIAKATSTDRTPTADDVDNYLRATATYTDKHGSGQTASAVSDNAVEARTVANAAPDFSAHDTNTGTTGTQATRTVDENAKGANVGKPVNATDGDDDVLHYTLDAATVTAGHFSIDERTGQIKTTEELDSHIETANADADDNERTFSVTVTATDPSGAKGEASVTITINNINDAPVFAKQATGQNNNAPKVTVVEPTTNLDDAGNTGNAPNYAATDDDAADTAEVITYAVTGADAKYFFIASNGGALAFCTSANAGTRDNDSCTEAHTPDYETKSSYSITITAMDDDRAVGKVDVTVDVTNAADDGKVSLSMREPQVDRPVVATLTDPDGSISNLSWQWYWDNDSTSDDTTTFPTTECSASSSDLCLIKGATSPSYTPKELKPGGSDNTNAPANWFLTARATYKDKVATDSAFETPERAVQASDPANTAPKFDDDNDPNTPGNQPDVERSVAENVKDASVGDPVVAIDADGDLRMYTIGGADASSFKVGRDTGQITTAAKLNYESNSSYTVVVTATDPSGATDTITVNVSVTDEDDPGVITGPKAVDYNENGADAVASYSATDEDGDAISWSISGADSALFQISDDGALSFKKAPSFEDKKDTDTDNIYMVTVTANKGDHKVEVTVTDVDEPGKVTLDQPQPQAGRTITASGADSDPDEPVSDAKWQWARSASMDGPWTDIDKANSAKRTPTTDDVGSYLRATVTYTDSFGSGKTASAVSENTVERRTVANAAPAFPDDANTRSVNENEKDANVGKPVSASDADGDILLYTLTDAGNQLTENDDNDTTTDVKTDGDSASFTIDSRSGQLKTKGSLDVASGADGDADGLVNTTKTVRVTATDPSGASKFVDVTVTINDVNDTPKFREDDPGTADTDETVKKSLWVTENIGADGYTADLRTGSASGAAGLADNEYQVTDDDTSDSTFTYGLEGADKDKFNIVAATGVLKVCTDALCGEGKGHSPNYEKQSKYSITITAKDNEDATVKLDVTVNVTDAEDAGTVKLNRREPQINQSVVASLSDPDGSIKGVKWQWYWDNDATLTAGDISGLDLTNDDNKCDAESSSLCFIDGATSPAYTPKGVNPAGGTATTDTRWYLVANVTYTDGLVTDANDDGDDDGDAAHKRAEAQAQASDPANTAPKFPDDTDANTPGDQGTYEFSVDENTDKAVASNSLHSAVAADPVDGDLLLYSLSGADAGSFTIVSGIDGPTDIGTIKSVGKLDYEAKSSYTVIATATDPSGATDTITVNISVNDLDDKPVISLNAAPAFAAESAERSVDENSEAGTAVGDPVAATDADGDTLTYALSGDDDAHFAIDDMGQITVAEGAMLDYEAEQNTYMVTVTATDTKDESDTIAVTISVNDVDENNAPAFDNEMYTRTVPENSAGGAAVGDPVTAMDADEDDTLAYSLADESGSFQIDSETGQISVAEGASLDYETQTSYTVTVTATDGEEATATAEVTINVGNVGLANPYDTDDSGSISKVEAVNAVKDYFDDQLSREDVLAVIRLYFG